MRRSAVACHSLPPAAAAAALGFGVAPPRALQALTMAAAATTFPPPGTCLPPCHRRRRSSLCSSVSSAASSASAATTALAVEEARRGRKQLAMEPPLYDYLLANVREHPLLRDLREETAAMRGSQMQLLCLGRFLPHRLSFWRCLCKFLGRRDALKSAYLLDIPESGRLVACERDDRCLEVAKRYYRLAGVAHKVDVKHALAVDSLKSLLESGEASSYDFAFVDADKKMYEEYFELLLKLVRVGGLIVMDNVLWYGRVADPLVNDSKTVSIRDFNKKLLEDKRVNISMVPIGDGMTICRKLEED